MQDAQTFLAAGQLPRYEAQASWSVRMPSIRVNITGDEDPIGQLREKYRAFLTDIGADDVDYRVSQMYSMSTVGDSFRVPASETAPLLH